MVDCGGLENRWACKRPVGSNPTPSASRSFALQTKKESFRTIVELPRQHVYELCFIIRFDIPIFLMRLKVAISA